MDKKKDIIHVTLRMPKDLYKKVKSAAQNDIRSMNTYILKIVEDYLDKKDNDNG